MRLHVISCQVFERELAALAPRARARVTVSFLPMGLHEKPTADLRQALQEAIETVPAQEFDVVAVGYGVCNRGVAGVQARTLPLVFPRAHDCCCRARRILNTGDLAGQLLRASAGTPAGQRGVARPVEAVHAGADLEEAELVARYEENARYLINNSRYARHYQRLIHRDGEPEPRC
jgi:hypothetical protein